MPFGNKIYLFSTISVLLRETTNPKDLRRLEEGGERSLMDVDLAVVDELHQGVEIRPGDVLEYYHRVLTRGRL